MYLLLCCMSHLCKKVNRLIAIEPSKEGDILIEVAVTSWVVFYYFRMLQLFLVLWKNYAFFINRYAMILYSLF